MRRDEGRVVDPPLVFKKDFFQGTKKEKTLPWIERPGEESPAWNGLRESPGWRKLEGGAKEIGVEWKERRRTPVALRIGDTLTAPAWRMNCNLLLQ
ncbi:hypothetical protein TNCV_233071 [Trichonephila clavipes]|nr:hypothetical protein TNCV_233071 [Trichonephila clavipes]